MLKLRNLLLAGVGLLALTPLVAGGPAIAGGSGFERQLYTQSDRGWQVDYIPAVNSCVLGRKHTEGTTLQIFVLPDGFTLMVTNARWRNIRAGESYKLAMVMDGGADKWNGVAEGTWTYDGAPGLIMGPVNKAFMTSFIRRNRADIYNGETGTWVTALTLDGTAAGTVALIECQQAHGEPHAPRKPSPAPKPDAREFTT